MGEHYPFFVAWPYFTEQLCKFLGISKNQEALVLQHKGYQCLQVILGMYYNSTQTTVDRCLNLFVSIVYSRGI